MFELGGQYLENVLRKVGVVLTDQVYALDVASGGQNNQKLAILGLIALAQEQGADFRVPDRVRDWTPLINGESGKVLNFGDAYDKSYFKKIVGGSEKIPTRTFGHSDCFLRGAKQLSDSGLSALRARDAVSDVLAALRPSSDIQIEIDRLITCMPPGTVSVQLRIERDWQEHIRKKKWVEGITGDREIILHSKRIFQKLRAQEELHDVSQLYICCDEDDLIETQQQIRESAKELGFNLWFKSQLSTAFQDSRLKRSLVDFGVCLAVDKFVGSCLSTFSNVLCITKSHEINDVPRHYIYDAADERVLQRRDYGRAVSPSRVLSVS